MLTGFSFAGNHETSSCAIYLQVSTPFCSLYPRPVVICSTAFTISVRSASISSRPMMTMPCANGTSSTSTIQVEINFLMRACALPPRVLPAAALADSPPCAFLVLATEELFAGKIKAMIDRRHPRDLYDLFRFAQSGLPHDADTLRKLSVLFSSTMDRDFRTYDIARVSDINTKEMAPCVGRSPRSARIP